MIQISHSWEKEREAILHQNCPGLYYALSDSEKAMIFKAMDDYANQMVNEQKRIANEKPAKRGS